jgi:hypothetical protein
MIHDHRIPDGPCNAVHALWTLSERRTGCPTLYRPRLRIPDGSCARPSSDGRSGAVGPWASTRRAANREELLFTLSAQNRLPQLPRPLTSILMPTSSAANLSETAVPPSSSAEESVDLLVQPALIGHVHVNVGRPAGVGAPRQATLGVDVGRPTLAQLGEEITGSLD